MDVVLAYRNAREYMSTSTNVFLTKDEEADSVAEYQESGIECEDEDGILTTKEVWILYVWGDM